jgi:hypothetical protein
MEGTALIDGPYRYWLRRQWSDGPLLLWILLNPSIADAIINDPTVRRVIGFSQRFGYGAAMILNLFAFRATSPGDLLDAYDPVGPRNDEIISEHILDADLAICAWGAMHKRLRWRLKDVAPLLDGPLLKCLGRTKAGDPRHPLYLPNTADRVPWMMS